MTPSPDLLWPVARAGEALAALVARSRLHGGVRPSEPVPPASSGDLDAWMEVSAERLGLEATRFELFYDRIMSFLERAGPTLFRVGPGEKEGLLVLLSGGRRTAVVLPLVGEPVKLDRTALRTAIAGALEDSVAGEIEMVLGGLSLSTRRREHVRATFFEKRLGGRYAGEAWALNLSPGRPFAEQIRGVGMPRLLVSFLASYLLYYLLLVASWGVIGRGALTGSIEAGWLQAWGLILATLIPARVAATWLQGLLGLSFGTLLKKRLFWGALRLDPPEIRRDGIGRLFGRAVEAESLENVPIAGALAGLLGTVELLVTFALLLAAAANLVAFFLVAVVAGGLVVARVYTSRRRVWAERRLELSHRLVENMVGFRTRVAQEPSEAWHRGEDADLAAYLAAARRMDAVAPFLLAGVPRLWLLLGIGGLAPLFIANPSVTPSFAIAIGAILLGLGGFRKLASSAIALTDAVLAWSQIGPIFRAAAREEAAGNVVLPRADAGAPGVRPVEARGVVFRHAGRPEPVLQACDLTIRPGEKILLAGPSGGGKSTLASLLCGLRTPDSGVILVRGLDRATLGLLGFRRHVALAPQFHENHILSETLAFNLLMGRRWPPTAEDLALARTVCEELGLGDLVSRMHAGLFQMVGDSGWQLSHGERSRVFVARALLQGADVVVLDESLAALDPATTRQVLDAASRRAPALLLIAHP